MSEDITNSKRQLAAILFADIQGYTRLMQNDEDHASKLLRKFQKVMSDETEKYNGFVANDMGDGMVCTFPSSVEAVKCAISLHKLFTTQPRVPVRIGIHSGTVVMEGGKIFGNSVNLASRIESLSVPGAVLVSKSIKDDIINQSEMSLKSVGRIRLKNVIDPIEIFAINNDGFVVPDLKKSKGKIQNERYKLNKYWPILAGLVIVISILALQIASCNDATSQIDQVESSNQYEDLVALYHDWRAFEKPPLMEGAPDYTKTTFDKRWPEFQYLQAQLTSMDTTGWPLRQQVDWMIVWAEMNGYDFNHNILKPWVRDPAFYKSLWTYRSDVPAHEGPTHHMTTEIWTYDFPLSSLERERLLSDLSVIPSLNDQAMQNLTGNARDLWVTGIRDIRNQSVNLSRIKEQTGVENDEDLINAIDEAITSTNEFADWLEDQASLKNGPSGIGKENYSWYLQNVHLVPLTWEDEVLLLKRELARAWSSLKLEEHRNRDLPLLNAVDSPEAYNKLADDAAKSLMSFLEDEDIVTVKDYFDPALREHLGQFIPEARRNFFWITVHYDPRPLYSHFYHWFELARMDTEPHSSEIRRDPLLYNIFDSRNEGMATAVEEMFMQAGLYDDNPRVREIVYIMIAQRAARGLGSLYAHANEMTMEEAGSIHSEYTPRGWMKTEKDLLIFEQHLYLRQPGYGTSYITGKYLMEQAMAELARIGELQGEDFELKDYFDQLNAIGNIPISLGAWELTGARPFHF